MSKTLYIQGERAMHVFASSPIHDLNLYMCTVCTVLKCVHVCMCVHVCLRVRACVCDDDAVPAAAAADDDDIKISQANDCFIIKPSPSS